MWIGQISPKKNDNRVCTYICDNFNIEESELYPQNAHIVLLLAYSIDGRCAYNFSRVFLR